MELYSHINSHLSKVEALMEESLGPEDERIYGMLLPFIRRGGKRIRPALTILSCGAAGGDYLSAAAPASIIEMFHNFTLIHDDIEDDSRFRRGEPALHVSHGIAIALNSGDALYTLLWKKLLSFDMPPRRLIRLQALYADSFKRVVDGQGLELSWIRGGRFDVSEDEYLLMIGGKTSALMGLSCETGAMMAGSSARVSRSLRSYGEKLGAAFQIQDDVLNITGDFEKYKKEIGGDISEGKRTLMVVHFLSVAPKADREKLVSILSAHSREQADLDWAISALTRAGSVDYARARAKKLVEEANRELARLPDSQDKRSLLEIASYVISRER
ncbi:polyprenyl synthetase family protein [Candidatus Micrarchaeota archaeon]|nr:polyprenyl synthetase family protein [Candidatus Micrarchaeota archaeon]